MSVLQSLNATLAKALDDCGFCGEVIVREMKTFSVKGLETAILARDRFLEVAMTNQIELHKWCQKHELHSRVDTLSAWIKETEDLLIKHRVAMNKIRED